jgi:hypothetical protein
MDKQDDGGSDQDKRAGDFMTRRAKNDPQPLVPPELKSGQDIEHNMPEEFQFQKLSTPISRNEMLFTILFLIGISVTTGLLASYSFSTTHGVGIFLLEVFFVIALLSMWVRVKRA